MAANEMSWQWPMQYSAAAQDYRRSNTRCLQKYSYCREKKYWYDYWRDKYAENGITPRAMPKIDKFLKLFSLFIDIIVMTSAIIIIS